MSFDDYDLTRRLSTQDEETQQKHRETGFDSFIGSIYLELANASPIDGRLASKETTESAIQYFEHVKQWEKYSQVDFEVNLAYHARHYDLPFELSDQNEFFYALFESKVALTGIRENLPVHEFKNPLKHAWERTPTPVKQGAAAVALILAASQCTVKAQNYNADKKPAGTEIQEVTLTGAAI